MVAMREPQNAHKALVEKSHGEHLSGCDIGARTIKMDLGEIGCEDVTWIRSSQDRIQEQVSVLNLRIM
jgi:hypothetical protein